MGDGAPRYGSLGGSVVHCSFGPGAAASTSHLSGSCFDYRLLLGGMPGSASTPRSELESVRLRRALWAAIAGIACLAVALAVSFTTGYDNLASGTLGGNATTLLFVASAALLIVAAVTWTRASTLPGLRTSWRRVGRITLILWGLTIALLVLVVILGRVAPMVAPVSVLIASLAPVLLLPTLLWFPVWTLISAIRGQGATGSNQEGAPDSVEVPVVPPSVQAPVPSATQTSAAPEPQREPRPQGAGPGRGLVVAGAVIGVVIVSLIATVFYLLGRQSNTATGASSATTTSPTSAPATSVPSVSPTTGQPAGGDEMTPAELYGLAAAARGCTGPIPDGLPPDAALGFISFDSGSEWEPIYIETAERLGVPDVIGADWAASVRKAYLFRSQAFNEAESADPRSWYDLNQLWVQATDYAYTLSEEVVLAREPRSDAFLGVAKKFGPKLTDACMAPVYRVRDLATADGLTFDAWIQQYMPDMGP